MLKPCNLTNDINSTKNFSYCQYFGAIERSVLCAIPVIHINLLPLKQTDAERNKSYRSTADTIRQRCESMCAVAGIFLLKKYHFWYILTGG